MRVYVRHIGDLAMRSYLIVTALKSLFVFVKEIWIWNRIPFFERKHVISSDYYESSNSM